LKNFLQKNEYRFLGLLLFFGLLVRIAALWAASALPFWTHHRLDAQIYHEAGLRIAAGDWTLGREVFHMSPLYSYLVGLLYTLFGNNPWVVPLFQSALGVLMIALIWATARLLWKSSAWSLLSAALVAFYGPAIFYESHTLSATLDSFLWTLLIWRLCCAVETGQQPSNWAIVGLCWGLCVLSRPNALLLLPLLSIGLFFEFHQKAWKPLFAFGLVGLIVLSPATLRNRLVAGEWVWVTDSGGINFYIGNAKGATGTFRRPPGLEAAGHPSQQFALFRRVAEQASGRRLTARQVDSFWYRMTWVDIRQEPYTWLRLLRNKLWLFWSATELSNNQDYEFTRTFLNPVLAAPLVQFGWLSPWSFLGLLLFLWWGMGGDIAAATQRTAKQRAFGRWLALATATLIGSILLFFVLARYRLALFSSLLLCAVAALREVVHRLRAASWSRAALLSAAAFSLYPLVYTVWLERSFAEEYFKLGFAYHIQKRFVQAEQSYLRAIRYDANHLSSYKNLAYLYENRGHKEQAIFQWKQILNLPEIHHSLRQLAQLRIQALLAVPQPPPSPSTTLRQIALPQTHHTTQPPTTQRLPPSLPTIPR
jgi:tetratricopeptide (TPR) repeat protein